MVITKLLAGILAIGMYAMPAYVSGQNLYTDIATENEWICDTYAETGTEVVLIMDDCGTATIYDDEIVSVIIPGDVNDDGIVDGRDVVRLMKYLSGEDTEISEINSDVTEDGNVDERDLLRIMKGV